MQLKGRNKCEEGIYDRICNTAIAMNSVSDFFCIFNQEFVRSRVTITQHLAEGSNTANKTGWMTAGLSRNCSSLSPIFQENCCFPCFDYVLLCRRFKALLRLRSEKTSLNRKLKIISFSLLIISVLEFSFHCLR